MLLDKISNFLKKITEALVILLYAAMVVVVFAQVYTRYLTDNSLTWSEELSRFIMIWMLFLASTLAFRQGSHIVVDNIVNLLPSKIKAVVKIIAYLFIVIFIGVVLWGAFKVLPITALQISPTNNIKMSYVYMVIPISMVIMIIDVIRQIINDFSFVRGGKKS